MRITELRRKKRKTQAEIAQYLKMGQSSYQHYESGRSEPSIDALIKLADYYNVSLDYLVGRERADDIGFLTHEQVEVVKLIKKLNYKNLILVNGRILETVERQSEDFNEID